MNSFFLRTEENDFVVKFGCCGVHPSGDASFLLCERNVPRAVISGSNRYRETVRKSEHPVGRGERRRAQTLINKRHVTAVRMLVSTATILSTLIEHSGGRGGEVLSALRN